MNRSLEIELEIFESWLVARDFRYISCFLCLCLEGLTKKKNSTLKMHYLLNPYLFSVSLETVGP